MNDFLLRKYNEQNIYLKTVSHNAGEDDSHSKSANDRFKKERSNPTIKNHF